MRGSNKLSAAFIRSVKKPGLYNDGHNLCLQVSTFGTKAWIFRFMLDGVDRKMGLGPLHTVSLAEARAEALEARKLVWKGIDPIEAAKAARGRLKAEAAKVLTFGECARLYIEANRATWKNARHAAHWHATFNETKRGSTVFPAATQAINGLPVSAIDTGLVLKVLEPLWSKTPETAARIRGRIERVLDWARVRGYREGENPARWEGHLKETLPPRSKRNRGHHDAVPYIELPRFMRELRAKSGVSARALELAVLTAARTNEVLGAKWSEVDFEAGLWTIPAERMKAGREHRVPLSPRAIEVLSSLPREGELVFVGRSVGKPLSDVALLDCMRSIRGHGATVHGLRSSFKDWATEQTSYPNELTEAVLAHTVSDKTEAAYRRGDMMEKRRRLMADWAAYCERPPAARDNVVAIREIA
jgi:integrase